MDPPRKRRVLAGDMKYPTFVAGLLEYHSISPMEYTQANFPGEKRPRNTATMCHLCEDQKATHYIWEANVGRLIGVDSCHIFLCGKCVVFGLRKQNSFLPCAQCQKYWPPPVYTVKLANGKMSKRLCQECHLEGGHRKELADAIKSMGPEIKLNKSI
jgi:hypothetical protein